MIPYPTNLKYTVLDVANEVKAILENSKSDQISANTELILLDVLALKNRAEIYLNRNQPVSEEQRLNILDIAQKKVQGIPLQYLLKKAEFFSLEVELSRECFIPRPETELLVEHAIEWIKASLRTHPTILDIGTGPGTIAISIAKNLIGSKIVAIDISLEALKVAQKNIQKNDLFHQIQLIASNLTQGLSPKMSFDLIISNPPYIDEKDWETLSDEVRLHEPRAALWGGKDGMETIFKIIQSIPSFLKSQGAFFMEFGGSKQTAAILKAAETTHQFCKIEILKDYSGEDRIFKAIRK